MSGIYIHIPFCKQACSYCDFHFSTSLRTKEDFLRALLVEIELRKNFLSSKELDSIYLGGGTPSLLQVREFVEIRDTILEHFSLKKNAEITMEVNPDDVSKSKFESLASEGVNRFSIGIQSFFQADLDYMNRSHDAQQAIDSLRILNELKNTIISADLIFGSPTTANEMLVSNLEQLTHFENVKHISAYALTVEDKTPLQSLIKRGLVNDVDQEIQSGQFDIIYDYLKRKGFQQYEISNYSIPGFEAVHNTNYWKNEEYLGLGPSAHSYDGKDRYFNIANNVKYIKGILSNESVCIKEELTSENRYNEYVLTSLRTMWGINLLELRDTFPNFYYDFITSLESNDNPEWFAVKDSIVTLTSQGKHFADSAALRLFV